MYVSLCYTLYIISCMALIARCSIFSCKWPIIISPVESSVQNTMIHFVHIRVSVLFIHVNDMIKNKPIMCCNIGPGKITKHRLLQFVALTLSVPHNIIYFLADPGIRSLFCTCSLNVWNAYIHSTGVFVDANHPLSIMLKALSVAKVFAW